MKQDEILLSDLTRIFFGQTPPIFLLEVVAGALLFFVLIILAMRLVGRRFAGQLSIVELAIMVMLGAGLWILPHQSEAFDKRILVESRYACGQCGYVVEQQGEPEQACRYCQHSHWERAVKRLGTDKLYQPQGQEDDTAA